MKKSLLYFTGILFSLQFTACKKELSCENCKSSIEPLAVPAGDSVLYYQFTLENKNYQAIAYQNNFIVGGGITWNLSADRDSGSVIASALIPPNTTSFPLAPYTFSFERGIIKDYSNLTQLLFQNFFSTGNYLFADLKEIMPPFTPIAKNGIALLWADENGVIWRTDKGTADQSGSKFMITGLQSIVYPWTTTPFPTRVVAEFTCKLYDDNGRSKVITNGRLAYYFAKDF